MAQVQRATPARKPTSSRQRHDQQTFLEHLSELRGRLFVVVVALCLGTGVGFAFHNQIAHVLLAPLAGERLVYLTPGGGFDFIFHVSLYTGIVLAIPAIIYEFYSYLAPAMKRDQTRRFTLMIMALTCLLAVSGIVFGYFFILPAALHFLIHLADGFVQANLTASSYLDFVAMHSLGFAAIFELPILLLIVNETNGPLTPKQLFGSERYIVPAAFILAAMFAPTPDMLSQLTVALPIVLIYQLGVIMVLLKNRRRSQGVFKLVKTPATEGLRPLAVPRLQRLPSAPQIVPQMAPPTIRNNYPKLATLPQEKPAALLPRQRIAMDIMPITRQRPRAIPKAPARQVQQLRSRSTTIDGFFSGVQRRPIDSNSQRSVSFV